MSSRPTPDTHAFWMPFTANRQFKSGPRISFVSARGMYYRDAEGREILDGTGGLWCVAAGHGRDSIADAIAAQARSLDFSPAFQVGHPQPFRLATRLAAMAPTELGHVFFTNSGSEAVDTALKIALAYHRARGDGHRIRLIGRERAYHGVNFGGMSVAGIGRNRRQFPVQLPGVDHLRHTYDRSQMAFSRGQPAWGRHLADDLEHLAELHDPSTIAAVIVEPVAGATGVLVPPVGYLDRLRELCSRFGILLIFDEVVTGFGRLGAAFAAEALQVKPDLITFAKAVTNATVPLGGVLVSSHVHDAILDASGPGIEFFHGYTYSGHPVSCAAGNAALDIYESEQLFDRARTLSDHWETALHSLAGEPLVTDIRNLGLLGAVELESLAGSPGVRGAALQAACFREGLFCRAVADSVVLSPPLIIDVDQIDRIVSIIRAALRATQWEN